MPTCNSVIELCTFWKQNADLPDQFTGTDGDNNNEKCVIFVTILMLEFDSFTGILKKNHNNHSFNF